MNVLITGANGFLGYYLAGQLLQKSISVIATGKGSCRLPFKDEKFSYVPMDFTDPFSVHDVFAEAKPDVVVHCGAMSKPDDCELQQAKAYLTNVESTVTLLTNAEEQKCFFIFVSTDFVFDGEKENYREDDSPNPVNYYGRTKLEAEEAVKEYPCDWCIVRTALVYGKTQTGRDNILTIVKNRLEKGEEYRVFDDQVRTPTYVEDLAIAIVTIIEKRAFGVYHISGKDILTPYKMALMTAEYLGLDTSLLKRVTAADMSQPAKRPPKTNFIIQKAGRELGFEPISFEEGLRKTFS